VAGARDRKRAERQKRKRRSADSAPGSIEAAAGPNTEAAESNGGSAASETFQEKMARRYEERNAEARAKLEPLEEGERPGAVTAGAVVSALLAIVFTVSAGLAIAGVDAGGRHIKALPIIVFGTVLWAMTIGMWRARYWAVLGFQTVLLLVMLASAFGLVVVTSVLQAVGTTLLLAGSGTLFYFMIRAMARIQMPQSPGAD
jgi:threonine/homoserine/homoserine lactone efflux protein